MTTASLGALALQRTLREDRKFLAPLVLYQAEARE